MRVLLRKLLCETHILLYFTNCNPHGLDCICIQKLIQKSVGPSSHTWLNYRKNCEEQHTPKLKARFCTAKLFVRLHLDERTHAFDRPGIQLDPVFRASQTHLCSEHFDPKSVNYETTRSKPTMHKQNRNHALISN